MDDDVRRTLERRLKRLERRLYGDRDMRSVEEQVRDQFEAVEASTDVNDTDGHGKRRTASQLQAAALEQSKAEGDRRGYWDPR